MIPVSSQTALIVLFLEQAADFCLSDSSQPNLDFRNPENFFHDVNGVTGLLKQFFRDLPDPLLTKEHYAAFIEAASKPQYPTYTQSLRAASNYVCRK